MNIFSYYKDFISNILIELAKEDKVIDELPLYKFTVEPPRELNHGDLATNPMDTGIMNLTSLNVCMVYMNI